MLYSDEELFVCLVGCFTAFAQSSLFENCCVTIELPEGKFRTFRIISPFMEKTVVYQRKEMNIRLPVKLFTGILNLFSR